MSVYFIFFIFIFNALAFRLNLQQKYLHKFKPQEQDEKLYQHQYFNIEESQLVSSSRSIKYLTQCKDLCLQMHQLFPFQFKYHRVIYRQSKGDTKYFTGQCLYTFRKSSQQKFNKTNANNIQKKAQTNIKNGASKENVKKWFGWKKLKQFTDMLLFDDQQSKQQKKAWQSYLKDCQDDSLRLSESSRMKQNFTIVHSDFQYYQNQGFKNLRPFNDIGQLLSRLKPRI